MTQMKLSDFNYHLPKELIAQEGLPNREDARLMILHKDGSIQHSFVKNLADIFHERDLLVLNDTRVIRSKLIGKKETGGKVDCLILPEKRSMESSQGEKKGIREVLLRGRNFKPGIKIFFTGKTEKTLLKAEVIEKIEGARYRVRFDDPMQIEKLAEIPLPPYIKKTLSDPERYQTVYSENAGSLAAPTAGLHFTPSLMDRLKKIGVEFVSLTLHVDVGTFAPIRSEELEEWKMHPEYYRVSEECADKINGTLKSGRRIFAVGTTTVRTLESTVSNGGVRSGEGWTDIFIYPGYTFKFPYAGLLTNFHLPKSTLILLVSAFVGRERILDAYQDAMEKRYRFYSFGDTMLVLK